MGAIRVEHLSKAYRQYPTRWARLREWLVPGKRPRHSLKWVLQDISFAVQPGEVVGILGVNGAGKSTLLKILAGTTQATAGTARVEGRTAALLELGMGFHPDFTGRQNALLSGQLMGLSATDISDRFEQIEAFAEIGAYFDQPLRVYSSGMIVRLAFSVATLVRPDVLIVDEALAVGDAFFQVKSFARIREFKRLGTTILFVSHDLGSIKTLCDRAMLLNDGRVERDGSAVAVSDYYAALTTNRLRAEHIVQDISSDVAVTRSGTRDVEMALVRTLDAHGEPKSVFFCGERARIEILVDIIRPIAKLVQGFLIRDPRGNDVYGTNTFHLDKVVVDPKIGQRYRVSFDFDVDLAEGVYSISGAAVNSDTVLWENFDWIENVAVFRVLRANKPFSIGVASLDVACRVDLVAVPGAAESLG
jgi:lipopolysaccharide transport system ATP-binding protein